MGQLNNIENNVVGVTERVSSAYAPSLQLTQGQPPPIAANGGLSYMSFDRDGDAGTAAATENGDHPDCRGGGAGGYRHARQRAPRAYRDQVGRRVSQLRRVPGIYSGDQHRSP